MAEGIEAVRRKAVSKGGGGKGARAVDLAGNGTEEKERKRRMDPHRYWGLAVLAVQSLLGR